MYENRDDFNTNAIDTNIRAYRYIPTVLVRHLILHGIIDKSVTNNTIVFVLYYV
jgi:hypothetical protein